ncbi:hypothetical protein EUX98_g3957 [Antrodiella citrinella]|uniref:non-specific serine/threonine protein kinase n=1 Tax=Antrodiella citrinella TaxID=2447956 RepID=A0A4V3XIR6_9APHY|nr:hypothetical protein EUX98_g3957 [Antrodiella citrinella]
MLSVLRTTSPQQQSPTLADSKPKLKSVLGFGPNSTTPTKSLHPRAVQRTSALVENQAHLSLARRSIDTITDLQVNKRKKNRTERPSTPEVLSFEHDAVTVSKPAPGADTMKNGSPAQSMPRRMPFRVDGQDGPWAISVAETPHDASSYSLYVKTPTHNLTLTRTASEIVEMDAKLRDSYPSVKIPTLPIDASALPPPPPKRKSAFLNTLSRLASPSGSKSSGTRHVSHPRPSSSQGQLSFTASLQSSAASSSTQTPIASPAHEMNDPFTSLAQDAATPLPTNATVTALAAYLTSLANELTIRPSRTWKRFVRVRTDDLQSVRVERAIKRVRSDLAAHAGPSTGRSVGQVLDEDARESMEESANGQVDDGASTVEAGADRTVEGPRVNGVGHGTAGAEDADRAATPQDPKRISSAAASPSQSKRSSLIGSLALSTPATSHGDLNEPVTPLVTDSSHPSSRIPRSQSAEPSSRSSRIIYSPSVLRDGASSQTSVTGDDSSISTTGGRSARKKRSKSVDPKKSQRKVVIDDFEMMRVLGKGCAGKVLLVKHKPTADVFALKAITKRHVLAHQELQHTLTEQAVLKRMAAEGTDPFVVKLWFSFHDKENLFLVMDFHPGGDLATQLARWGRLGRDRARFYAAEIVEGVEGLHAAGVIYRDLKPENILIGADGHIVLTDFGLSKEFPRRTVAITAPPTPSGGLGGYSADYMNGSTGSPSPVASPPWMKSDKVDKDVAFSSLNDTTSTFCGTAEYLAPEVIQGLPYSYEVDWWSFGTMLYEMLTGITPFWANNHSDMYFRVLQDELQFPEDRTMDQDTKSLIRGLLQRNPALRMKEPRIKKHPYFSMIDWSHVYYKRYIPPYIPPIDPSNASDTQNFDDTFLDMEPVIKDDQEDNDQTDTDQDRQTDTDRTDGEDSVATPSQSRSPSVHPDDEVDVFDGYSFKGRHSVILDNEEEDDDEDDESGPGEDEDSSVADASLDNLLPSLPSEDRISTSGDMDTVEELPEPKTPEARPAVLPEEPAVVVPEVIEVEVKQPGVKKVEEVKEVVRSEVKEAEPQPLTVDTTVPATIEAPTPATNVSSPSPAVTEVTPSAEERPPRPPPKTRSRREKSGIPALDRAMAELRDEDGAATEREDEDEWDIVETNVNEERNGAKGTSLFARGVVDRYRLAVFRKTTPRRSGGGRNFSGVSMESEVPGSEVSDSPTPSEKQRRGRTPLTFRRHPKQFLRAKSPPSHSKKDTPSTRSKDSKSLSHSASATLSASTSSSAGLLTPSPSLGGSMPVTPSLKSKESAMSVGSPSESSDQSTNGDPKNLGGDTVKGASAVSPDEEKQKSKGLKKYKEGAEKVLSIFQSPR